MNEMDQPSEKVSFGFTKLFNTTYIDNNYKENYSLVEELFEIFINNTLIEIKLLKNQPFNTLYDLASWLHKNKTSFALIGLQNYYQRLNELELNILKGLETLESAHSIFFEKANEIINHEQEIVENYQALINYNKKNI